MNIPKASFLRVAQSGRGPAQGLFGGVHSLLEAFIVFSEKIGNYSHWNHCRLACG